MKRNMAFCIFTHTKEGSVTDGKNSCLQAFKPPRYDGSNLACHSTNGGDADGKYI